MPRVSVHAKEQQHVSPLLTGQEARVGNIAVDWVSDHTQGAPTVEDEDLALVCDCTISLVAAETAGPSHSPMLDREEGGAA